MSLTTVTAAQEPQDGAEVVSTNREDGSPPRIAKSRREPAAKEAGPAAGPLANPKPLPENVHKPEVLLSDYHRKTCRKFVGDRIDPIDVVTFAGEVQRFDKLLSDKLTVLIFWNERSILAAEQFRRIPLDVLDPFASYRVKVVAVHVGGTPERTRILTGDYADKIVSLVDAKGEFFHQLAESRIPRTYVLDKDGRILWLDIEYSPSTVRSLTNALTYFLTHDD